MASTAPDASAAASIDADSGGQAVGQVVYAGFTQL